MYSENSTEKESRSSIFSFSGNIDVKINENDKVVIINTDIFSGFCEVNKVEGIITNQYSDFISDLFDQISKPEEQVNEILAIVNLSMIQLKKNDSKLPINKLIRIIKENMKDRDFDLDALCEKAFVSRRKCQYIFSNHDTTFYAELKKARVENIRFEVIADSGSGTLESYVSKSGFKNIASANKSFNEIVGQKLREFIKSQRTT
ncbi:hypothetical protein KIT90_13130 [Vibrio sp. B172a]|uniref:hypothetical protein n=1 Tax=Vibrio sp. B172a TaxID=2835790 RepID=UPI002557AF83|nr:hypothetical protein [Vibrio sp. B172a]MDK9782325.1 hypothetical protein [Vibrio sp. B172a]